MKRDAMTLFGPLRSARAFAREHMPFVKRLEDLDMLLEIGFCQEQGRRLTVKQLYRSNIASMPTVQRRLQQLRRAGVLVERRSAADRRSVELELAPQALAVWQKYGELLRKDPHARY